jgi:nucleotide-binding universal stress UspA family protein
MEPMTIVAATDFSASARAATERAAGLAREHGAQLSLVYAFDEASWENLRSLATPKKKVFAEQPAHQAWEKIRTSAERLARRHRIRTSGVVATGRATEAIAASAQALQAALVVLGPHSRRLADRLYLGSTALGTARRLPVPVLVVKRRPSGAYARGLVGVDFSAASERAAIAAARLFPSAEITLVHAVPSVEATLGFSAALQQTIPMLKAALRERATERLARIFVGPQPGKLGHATRRLLEGPPAHALLRELERGRHDLVALGRAAESALVEGILGSVPANLLLNAAADVLIVP